MTVSITLDFLISNSCGNTFYYDDIFCDEEFLLEVILRGFQVHNLNPSLDGFCVEYQGFDNDRSFGGGQGYGNGYGEGKGESLGYGDTRFFCAAWGEGTGWGTHQRWGNGNEIFDEEITTLKGPIFGPYGLST